MREKFKFELGETYGNEWRNGKVFQAELIDGRYIVTWEDENYPSHERRTVYPIGNVELAITEGYWKVLD